MLDLWLRTEKRLWVVLIYFMRTLFRRYWVRFLPLLIPGMLSAASVSSKVMDRLDRPVTNALVDIHWLKTVSPDHVIKMDLAKLVSDRQGLIKGKYDEKSVPSGEDVWVEISKAGYNGYSTTGLRREFVLEREFGKADLLRIAALRGIEQVNELRELLAGEFEDPEQSRSELVFIYEQHLRPGLRFLVADSKVGPAAGELLAFIGLPEDLRLFLPHAPTPKRKLYEDRWAYGVVSALLEPTTDLEWAFLRSCAMNERDDRWVERGAITTLKLIASSRSKEILKEVERRSKGGSTSVRSALQYIDSSPAPLSDGTLIEAARRAAQVITIGKWKGNGTPLFNEQKDKALVNFEFIAGRDLLVYTATFHRVEGLWRLRGVRETMQALLARELDPAEKTDQKK